jgi:uncharacterized protein YeeX (DUF496 family)
MRRFLEYSVDDFVLDKEFAEWVLFPDKTSDELWAEFVNKYPHKRNEIMAAARLVRSVMVIEPKISLYRLARTWNKIEDKTKRIKQRRRRVNILKFAATAILLIGVSIALFYLNRENDFSAEIEKIHSSSQGQIILSDGTTKYFDTENSSVQQLESGDIVLNNDTVNTSENYKHRNGTMLNHVVIPYGKRLEITLSDGSHVWLNSGSKFSYPASFAGRVRKVYLSGEAYFDVAKDKERPFKILSQGVEIKVLGTSFNVCAYPEDDAVSAVLVEGSIKIREDKLLAKGIVIIPGQRANYNKKLDDFIIDEVDVNLYSSWINGYLVFKNEKVSRVVSKLERYYNKKIIVSPKLKKYSFSGKLDLNHNFESVIKKLTFALSARGYIENNQLKIKPM